MRLRLAVAVVPAAAAISKVLALLPITSQPALSCRRRRPALLVRTVRVSLSLSVPAALPIGRVSVPVGAAPVAVPVRALLVVAVAEAALVGPPIGGRSLGRPLSRPRASDVAAPAWQDCARRRHTGRRVGRWTARRLCRRRVGTSPIVQGSLKRIVRRGRRQLLVAKRRTAVIATAATATATVRKRFVQAFGTAAVPLSRLGGALDASAVPAVVRRRVRRRLAAPRPSTVGQRTAGRTARWRGRRRRTLIAARRRRRLPPPTLRASAET
mmetsp:Transcript_19517/g.56193  ORF Transcript_19517/g.56193 Transcript_19517/m.56193 type:complete len:269 (-) Transcript_19517:429-1235(-)